MKRSVRILLVAIVLTLLLAATASARVGLVPIHPGPEDHPGPGDHPTGSDHPGPGYSKDCNPHNTAGCPNLE